MDKQKSVDLLNKAVADELHAVHQYMYWHFHLDDAGYGTIATLLKNTAIQEMRHVEVLAERILFLGGDVNMELSKPVERITDFSEILQGVSKLEDEAINDYNRYVGECVANADSGTKRVFESLIDDEEAHQDTFDQQLDHLKTHGSDWIALQASPPSTPTEG